MRRRPAGLQNLDELLTLAASAATRTASRSSSFRFQISTACAREARRCRTPGLILEAACWSHARRPFFALADIEASARRKAEGKTAAPVSPLALEIVQRMDRLFEIERGINGRSAEERRATRQV